MGAVLQVDGAHTDAPTVHIQLRQNGQTAADAALAVKVPVVLLRQADHLRLLDGPAGENGVAVEALGVLTVHQLDEFQAEHVVHTQTLRQFLGRILLADDIVGFGLRAGFQEVAQLRQMDAAFHVEHQNAQGVRRFRRDGGDVVDLGLRELRDHGHDFCLGGAVQQRTQALPIFIGKSVHMDPPCYV